MCVSSKLVESFIFAVFCEILRSLLCVFPGPAHWRCLRAPGARMGACSAVQELPLISCSLENQSNADCRPLIKARVRRSIRPILHGPDISSPSSPARILAPPSLPFFSPNPAPTPENTPTEAQKETRSTGTRSLAPNLLVSDSLRIRDQVRPRPRFRRHSISQYVRFCEISSPLRRREKGF